MDDEITCPYCTTTLSVEDVACYICEREIPQAFTPAQQMQAVRDFTNRMAYWLQMCHSEHLGAYGLTGWDGLRWDKEYNEWKFFESNWGESDDTLKIPQEIFTMTFDEIKAWAEGEREAEQERMRLWKVEHDAQEVEREKRTLKLLMQKYGGVGE